MTANECCSCRRNTHMRAAHQIDLVVYVGNVHSQTQTRYFPNTENISKTFQKASVKTKKFVTDNTDMQPFVTQRGARDPCAHWPFGYRNVIMSKLQVEKGPFGDHCVSQVEKKNMESFVKKYYI